MKTGHSTQAKIVNHDSGMGAPDSETVRRRAAELARIGGRSVFNEQDWQEAKRELHGGQSLDNGDEGSDGEALFKTASERDMIATDTGHQIENIPLEDAGNSVEELICEGMDEAVHEQMLEAVKRDERDEG